MRRPCWWWGAGVVGIIWGRLLRDDRDVVVIDNLSRGSLERFGPQLGDARLHVVPGDVTDPCSCARCGGDAAVVASTWRRTTSSPYWTTRARPCW